jgi:hypothetical protein
LKLGYDLLCQRGNEELHVEVKGTTGMATEVKLTRREVDHARSYEVYALAVVSQISVNADYSIADVGRYQIFMPWAIDDDRLIATEYIYRL